jgi:hypothetical protein
MRIFSISSGSLIASEAKPFGLESFDPELTAEGLTAERLTTEGLTAERQSLLSRRDCHLGALLAPTLNSSG